jgi:hypothetical protein
MIPHKNVSFLAIRGIRSVPFCAVIQTMSAELESSTSTVLLELVLLVPGSTIVNTMTPEPS